MVKVMTLVGAELEVKRLNNLELTASMMIERRIRPVLGDLDLSEKLSNVEKTVEPIGIARMPSRCLD